MSEPSPNQEHREDLRAHGECRDCEAPLLRVERGYSGCGVCRVKRNVSRARQRGTRPGHRDARARIDEARRHRIDVLGYDDGAGDRAAVRARRR